MENTWSALLWPQLGAAVDMLENAVLACPVELWSDRSQQPEYWYVVYHTLFFQLNLILRQQTDSAPRWVARAKSS
ncbi:MAG TPA: hypothetical protein VNW71_21310 [Thermoanaerobaculia bacterium]|nr:hypothetical protein [Thermoanaerobaculia bacterium]